MFGGLFLLGVSIYSKPFPVAAGGGFFLFIGLWLLFQPPLLFAGKLLDALLRRR